MSEVTLYSRSSSLCAASHSHTTVHSTSGCFGLICVLTCAAQNLAGGGPSLSLALTTYTPLSHPPTPSGVV